MENNIHKLLMKYHPAKKEVDFQHFQNGKKVEIGASLSKFVKRKGTFVLQDYGDDLFEAIRKEVSGLKQVEIDVITTRLDYEDFQQMVEHYNKVGSIRITASLLSELPDMGQTFEEVKKYGTNALSVLETHRQKLFEENMGKESVRVRAEEFAQRISEEVDAIKAKIISLEDNKVSLCFVGVFSSGKSALINTILGYRILPEDIKSETAKMFKIIGLKADEEPRIEFDIDNVFTCIKWNKKKNCLEFEEGPIENDVRASIQAKINELSDKKKMCHEQMKAVLDMINGFENVASTITIFFQIPLDSERVQFTIYDTPGTDSNYVEHQTILEEALSAQTQSILIFVGKPDGLEGEGNNALLGYLQKAENSDVKTTIDIGRSLFVINKADGQSAQNRETLQEQEIRKKGDELFSIKLSDKKLFFTSARYAYAARAVKNQIADSQEEGFFAAGKATMMNEDIPMAFCYRQNRCATSEVATSRQIKMCDDAFAEAVKNKNTEDALVIASGIYALEKEMTVYGEKYASAVKAFAIIDSVDKALKKLDSHANSLEMSNKKDVEEITRSIKALRNRIETAVNEGENKYRINFTDDKKPRIPEETLNRLHLTSQAVKGEIIDPTKTYIDSTLKKVFFGLFGPVKVKDEHKTKVRKKVTEVVEQFTSRFMNYREEELTNCRDRFMELVKNAIAQDGDISEEAKEIMLQIEAPKIKKPKEYKDSDALYDANKRTGNLFIKEILDKDGFIDDVEESLTKKMMDMNDEYAIDYAKGINDVIGSVKVKFLSNLESFSLDMKEMIENRDDMLKLGKILKEASEMLTERQRNLNEIIWKEKE
jgi:hypothetical protein